MKLRNDTVIPLSVPNIDGNEWLYVKECLDTGWISSAGSFVTRFEEDIATFTGAKHAVACVNGTAALHIAQLVCGIKPNDYILVPNLTFVATLNAIKYVGADPILFDVDPETWQIDLDLVEEYLHEHAELREDTLVHKSDGRKISAVIPVHVLGSMCDMQRLKQIATKYKLEVIEDAAEALGSYYDQKHSGTIGNVGILSFNGNKIISAGGGGMLLTDKEHIAKRAKHLTTQAKSSTEEYIHDDVGYNYRLVNVLAAIGTAQLEKLPEIVKRNASRDSYYRAQLHDIDGIEFQSNLGNVEPNNWLTTIRIPDTRRVLDYLNTNGVQARMFWKPMNQLPMFAHNKYHTQRDVAAEIYNSAISIPSSGGITDEQLEVVVHTLRLAVGTKGF